jgi:hypothetical protein
MVTEKSVTQNENENDHYLGSNSISEKSVCIPDRVEAYTNVELICNTLLQEALTQNRALCL